MINTSEKRTSISSIQMPNIFTMTSITDLSGIQTQSDYQTLVLSVIQSPLQLRILICICRDLGESLRKVVAKEFPQGPISQVDEVRFNKDFEALHR